MHEKIGRGIAQEQYQGIPKVKVRSNERYGAGTKFSESGIVADKDKSAAVFAHWTLTRGMHETIVHAHIIYLTVQRQHLEVSKIKFTSRQMSSTYNTSRSARQRRRPLAIAG